MELGVNIDHIATIRQARRGREPNPVAAALEAELGGADGIVLHLREDRRHIQDRDVLVVREAISTKMTLEMGLAKDIVEVALRVKPDQVLLVPERRQELTTEGGLDVAASRRRVAEAAKRFQRAGILVGIFVDAEEAQIEASRDAGGDLVELHTGPYANAGTRAVAAKELARLRRAAAFAQSLGLVVDAGHGLTYLNVKPVAAIEPVVKLNIGHSIVSRAVFVGMRGAVAEMKRLMDEARRA
jgi:pyridoxine 5-phosphate synthase